MDTSFSEATLLHHPTSTSTGEGSVSLDGGREGTAWRVDEGEGLVVEEG